MPELMKIEFEIEIAAPPDKVWNVFTTAEGMRSWLGMKSYEPKIGGDYKLEVSAPDGDVLFFGKVMVFDPPKEFAFTWIQQEAGQEPWPEDTLVTLNLTPTSGGTQVWLTHTGFEKLPAAIAKKEYEGHIVGWERANSLVELKEIVEKEMSNA